MTDTTSGNHGRRRMNVDPTTLLGRRHRSDARSPSRSSPSCSGLLVGAVLIIISRR